MIFPSHTLSLVLPKLILRHFVNRAPGLCIVELHWTLHKTAVVSEIAGGYGSHDSDEQMTQLHNYRPDVSVWVNSLFGHGKRLWNCVASQVMRSKVSINICCVNVYKLKRSHANKHDSSANKLTISQRDFCNLVENRAIFRWMNFIKGWQTNITGGWCVIIEKHNYMLSAKRVLCVII